MAFNFSGVPNPHIFKHSSSAEIGLGEEKQGQGEFIVSLDGTGDFDTLQEAHDALTGTIKTIFLKEGTYTEDLTITKDGVVIRGEGDKSKIVGRIYANSVNNIIVDNLMIDGNGGSDGALFVNGCNKLKVINCSFTNRTAGVKVDGSSKTIIKNNRIYSNSSYGIELVGALFGSGGVFDTIISGNHIYSNSSAGVYLNGSASPAGVDHTIISSNVIQDNGGSEVNISNSYCNYTLVSSNNLHGSATNSLTDNGTNTTLTGNIL